MIKNMKLLRYDLTYMDDKVLDDVWQSSEKMLTSITNRVYDICWEHIGNIVHSQLVNEYNDHIDELEYEIAIYRHIYN